MWEKRTPRNKKGNSPKLDPFWLPGRRPKRTLTLTGGKRLDEAGQAHMHERDQFSYGLGWVWALAGLILIGLLVYGGWRMSDIMRGGEESEPIYAACIDTYGDNNCRCFSGVLSVQLSRYGYQSYVRELERDAYRRRYFDGRLAQNTLTGRDARVCVDASDICGVPVCEPPRYDYYQNDLDADPAYAPQTQERPFGETQRGWGEGS
jgi:hypothetical protein